MKKKKYIIGAISLIVVTLAVLLFYAQVKKTDKPVIKNTAQSQVQETVTKKSVVNASAKKPESDNPAEPQKCDLMDETSYSLSTVTKFAKLSGEVKNKVKTTAESYQNVYATYFSGDNLVFIVQEQFSEKPYSRHGLKKVTVSMTDGKVEESLFEPENSDEDSELDMWQYEKISGQQIPVKHTKYNENKEIEYVETWNYKPDEDIKYEVKDRFGNPVSVMKETQENDSNLRQEHIFYDPEGNTKLNVSASWDGPNIVRFTYFNPEDSENSMVSIREYQDGLTTKETVYNSDYKVKNVYTSDYKDGVRTDITVFDSENKEVNKFLSEE